MSTEHDGYHGQEHVEGQAASGAPARPESQADNADGAERGGGIETFAKVVFEGSYGIGCGGKQQIVRHNMTLAQARQTKWDFYGMCSNHMVCYDDCDRPVHEE